MTTKTRLNAITRRLDALAPAEPVVVRIVYQHEGAGDEPAGELVVDGRGPRVIQLRWPEDEDAENRRATLAQDARNS